MYVLSHLLEMHLPDLDNHLRKLGVNWNMFTSKLVMTLCSSYIPLEYLQYIYDVFFIVFLFPIFFQRMAGLAYIE